MKIIHQGVKLLTPCDGMVTLRQIEVAGRNCYRSEGKITEDSAISFVRG